MKKVLYIALFTLLGILTSFLVHAGLEIPILRSLEESGEVYSMGITWDNWHIFHRASGVILLLLGAFVGFLQGRHWWKVIYDKNPV